VPNLFGVPISHISKNALHKRIEEALIHSSPLWIVTANPEILLKAYRDNAYQSILNQADVIVADGVGVVLAARLLYGIRLERITGADLAEDILRLASQYQKKVFILGGSDEVNRKAIRKVFSFKFQVSSINGLGGSFIETEAMEQIAEYQPDMLFVALGAPRQEQFIYHLLKTKNLKLKTTLMMGIGGTIDFWARPKLRAPNLFRRMGLEWLWRLLRQPWRFPRIMNAVIIFPLICLYDFFNKKTLL